jgi:diguanylate cyclase (GGDEF)-like protein
MRHEDFSSLEVSDVVAKVLNHCQGVTGAEAVHWISALGLARVQDSATDTWSWSFSAADVVGKHVVSIPQADMFDSFHIWRKVSHLYAQSTGNKFSPHAIAAAPSNYFVLPVVYNKSLQGVMLLQGDLAGNPVALYGKLQPVLQIAARYIAFAYQLLEAQNLSFVDELTGLYNQRYLPAVLEHEIQRSKRDQAQFSLLFLDIDYFKVVNDGRGHWVGSKLLVEMGKVLKGQVRACDYAFRYGGDEFIILLGSSNSENSKRVAERIRKAVESQPFTVEGHSLNLTVSIGLATYPEHAQTAAALIQLADQAMYHGKRKSRNIVFVAS